MNDQEMVAIVNQVVEIMEEKQRKASRELTEAIERFSEGNGQHHLKDTHHGDDRKPMCNHYKHKANSNTGHIGISEKAKNGKYMVQFRRKYLGEYETLDQAIKVRKAAEVEFNLNKGKDDE